MPAPHLVPIKRVKAGTIAPDQRGTFLPSSSGEVSVSISWCQFMLRDWPPHKTSAVSYLSWSKQQWVPTIGDNNSLQNAVCLQTNSIPNCFVPPPSPCFDMLWHALTTSQNGFSTRCCSAFNSTQTCAASLSGCARLHRFTRVNSPFPDPSQTPIKSVCRHWGRLRVSALCFQARRCNKLITRSPHQNKKKICVYLHCVINAYLFLTCFLMESRCGRGFEGLPCDATYCTWTWM